VPASVSGDTLRRRTYLVGLMTLHGLEDKTYPGANVASLVRLFPFVRWRAGLAPEPTGDQIPDRPVTASSPRTQSALRAHSRTPGRAVYLGPAHPARPVTGRPAPGTPRAIKSLIIR
jgi:hypothetical protein